MKTIPSALATHYALAWHTLAQCIKITRTDAVVVGFTSCDRELVISGVTYTPGFDLSSLSSSATLAVDNMELTILGDDDAELVADLISGRWDNAAFELFEVDYTSTAARNVLKRGTLGEVQIKSTHYVVELRSLVQALQQTQGCVTSKTCRARLGDAKCTKSLTAFTYTGTLSGAVDRRHITDSARAEADGWFAEGILTFTSGDNDGFSHKIKAFSAGAFELMLPLPFDPLVGDAYSVVAGCRKRLEEDCRDKFANVVNFQGEPHLPGLDELSKAGAPETA